MVALIPLAVVLVIFPSQEPTNQESGDGNVVQLVSPLMPVQQRTPVAPTAQIGRASGTAAGQGPFVSSTLPTTGHHARFKRFENTAPGAAGQAGTAASTGFGPKISPYLNFARGGNTLNNYLS